MLLPLWQFQLTRLARPGYHPGSPPPGVIVITHPQGTPPYPGSITRTIDSPSLSLVH